MAASARRLPLSHFILLGAALIGAAWYGRLRANLHNEYFNIARALVGGRGFADAMGEPVGPTAWMPPLMPGLQAFLLWLSGGDHDVVVAGLVALHMSVLLGTGVLVQVIAWQTLQHLGVLTATAVFSLAVLYHFWYWFQVAHDCWLPLLFLDLLIAGCCWLQPLATWRRAAAWGLFGGACAMANPAVAFAWFFVSLALAWRQRPRSRGAVMLLCAGLVVTPWTIRNYVTFGRLIPIKSNLAYELFQTQCLQPEGLLEAATFRLHPNNPGSQERRAYQELGEIAYLDLKWRQFSAAVNADPHDFLERAATRFLGATIWYVPFNRVQEGRRPWVLWARRLAHPLPIIALLFLLWVGTTRPLPWAYWTVIGIYSLYLLPYVAASYYERYAVPMLPLKVLLVLWAADRLLDRGHFRPLGNRDV